jgi:hypothetical protein
MNGKESRDRPVNRVTVPEAAEMIGVTQSAIRKRVQRGTIPWDKDAEGRTYVYLDPSETHLGAGGERTRDTPAGQTRDELLEAYRDQVEFLRRELECKDTIIMSLTQRIPELEAPRSHQESPRRPRRCRIVPTHLRGQRGWYQASRSPHSAAHGGGSSLGWGNERSPSS